jgi:hypothetical protein
VCWNFTGVSLWLLCDVHFMQSTPTTRLQTRPIERGINNLLKLGVCAYVYVVPQHGTCVMSPFLRLEF